MIGRTDANKRVIIRDSLRTIILRQIVTWGDAVIWEDIKLLDMV